MQTPTHFLITAVLNRRLKRREADLKATGGDDTLPPVRSRWLLFGSIAPDLPLIIISAGFIAYDLLNGNMGPGSQSATGVLFNDLFFNSPWIKFAHNIFHAPLMTVAYAGVGYWAWQRRKRWGPALFYFGIACLIHSLIDIPVHYNDGPLLFFPFEWTTRFYSPVSYWDPARYGGDFAHFEAIVVIVCLVYLGVNLIQDRIDKRASQEQPA